MALHFDPESFGPKITALLLPERLAELGPGSPNMAMRPLLKTLTVERLVADQMTADADMARCCISALWLYHDFLDESHSISQEIETPSGSYWHGIMHRREPDAANAAYWFRRAEGHPVFASLAAEAQRLGVAKGTNPWSAFDFIDQCELHRRKGSSQELALRQLQRIEWQLLFDWCFRTATDQPRS